jgi:DNA-binding GntR family transcriptional regulator
MPRQPRGTSLTQTAYERLRADLLACRLHPGERLRINALCDTLGFNLSAVREALARLTAEGLVIAEPQRGFSVAPISEAELLDLAHVRLEIEERCVRRAIAIGDAAWEERLVAAHHRVARTPERVAHDPTRLSDTWAEANHFFHRALVGGCDSPWLLRLWDLLFAQGERYRRLSVPLARSERDIAQEHRDILAAALARDADRTVSLLTAHLEHTNRIVLAVGGGEAAELPQRASRADCCRSEKTTKHRGRRVVGR